MTQFTLSTLVTAQHPNELFKFMHVRNPITPPELQEQALFFTYNWSWASDNPSRFLHTLQTMRNNWVPWSDLVIAAEAFKNNSSTPLYIGSEWALSQVQNAKFLTGVVRYVDKNLNKEGLKSAFVAALPNLLPAPLADFLADPQTHQAELQLWDSIAIYAILNDPDAMLLHVTKALTALHLLKQYAATPNPTAENLKTWYSAQIILPDWVYEVFSRNEVTKKIAADAQFMVTPVATNTASDEVDLTNTDFVAIEMAVRDVRYKGRNGFDSFTHLEPATQMKLQTLNVTAIRYNYQIAEKVLLQAAADTLQTINIEAVYRKSAQEGVLCNPSYQNDCNNNRNWNVDFESPTSFMQSAFIGDLHKTVSQLLNFDLGEIAHIETVLKGETKRRVFTRLDRTELTTTTETARSEEKELDTTTDDRFGMERETAAVLSQQTNLSAGVSVSAEYGVPATGAVSG